MDVGDGWRGAGTKIGGEEGHTHFLDGLEERLVSSSDTSMAGNLLDVQIRAKDYVRYEVMDEWERGNIAGSRPETRAPVAQAALREEKKTGEELS